MRDGNAIKIGRQDDGVTMETADAIITDMTETFPDQGESTISISLTIDGFWTELVS